MAHKRCEKLIVAVTEEQVDRLDAIKATAAGNGVDDLVRLNGDEVRQLEPNVACLAALLSPSTGIVDSHAFMLALQGHAEANGAHVALMSEVAGLDRAGDGTFAVLLADGSAVTCRKLVVSAGLHASRLADTLDYGNGL